MLNTTSIVYFNHISSIHYPQIIFIRRCATLCAPSERSRSSECLPATNSVADNQLREKPFAPHGAFISSAGQSVIRLGEEGTVSGQRPGQPSAKRVRRRLTHLNDTGSRAAAQVLTAESELLAPITPPPAPTKLFVRGSDGAALDARGRRTDTADSVPVGRPSVRPSNRQPTPRPAIRLPGPPPTPCYSPAIRLPGPGPHRRGFGSHEV